MACALSAAEIHWRDFLASLQERGLHGTTFIVSDNHCGLRLQQNSLAYVLKIAMRSAVASELRQVL
jgi:putative transposase